MLLHGVKAQLQRQGRAAASDEFQRVIDKIRLERAFPTLKDFELHIYEEFYRSVEVIQSALDEDISAAAATEWSPLRSDEDEDCEIEGCFVCDKKSDAQEDGMEDDVFQLDEGSQREEHWTEKLQISEIRHVDISEFSQLEVHQVQEGNPEETHEHHKIEEVHEEYAEC